MAKKKNSKTINTVNNDVSPILMVAIFVIFIIAMIFVTYFGMNMQYPASKYFSQYDEKIENDLGKIITKQKQMDERIKTLSQDGGYTFDNPLVLKSPYEFNKLTAIVIFNTDEETKVEVSINDEPKTTVEKSNKHIIPLYGLYEGSKNIVKLTLENGKTKEIEIIFESFNFDINGFEVNSVIGDEDIYYMVGNTTDKKSNLRGFDNNNNMIAYYDLSHINGLKVFKKKVSVSYNQNMDVTNDIRLDVDYMGRITNISSETDDINKEANIKNDKVSYIGESGYLYDELIANYTTNELTINDSYSPKTDLDIKDFDGRLSSAVKYPEDYKISYMGEYIAFDIDAEGELIVVSLKGNIVSYKFNKHGIVRTNITGNKSLFVNVDGIVYSLKTTLLDKE